MSLYWRDEKPIPVQFMLAIRYVYGQSEKAPANQARASDVSRRLVELLKTFSRELKPPSRGCPNQKLCVLLSRPARLLGGAIRAAALLADDEKELDRRFRVALETLTADLRDESEKIG